MTPTTPSHPTTKLPGMASWLLAASLLLGLLCLGGLTRLAAVPTQTSHQPAASAPATIIPSSWRSVAP